MTKIDRCNKCGYNIKHIAHNLFKCQNCGYVLITHNSDVNEDFIPIIDTDLRRCEISWSDGYKTVFTKVYQLDLLNFYTYSVQRGNNFYAKKLERFIKQIDKLKQQNTDFNRKLPRIFLTRLMKDDEY